MYTYVRRVSILTTLIISFRLGFRLISYEVNLCEKLENPVRYPVFEVVLRKTMLCGNDTQRPQLKEGYSYNRQWTTDTLRSSFLSLSNKYNTCTRMFQRLKNELRSNLLSRIQYLMRTARTLQSLEEHIHSRSVIEIMDASLEIETFWCTISYK